MSMVFKPKYSDEYIDRTIKHFERMAQEIKELRMENSILKHRLKHHI